jgi:hypothetical protein
VLKHLSFKHNLIKQERKGKLLFGVHISFKCVLCDFEYLIDVDVHLLLMQVVHWDSYSSVPFDI